MSIYKYQKIFAPLKKYWSSLHWSVISCIGGCLSEIKSSVNEIVPKTVGMLPIGKIWFLVNTFTRPQVCATLSVCVMQCVRRVKCQKRSACWYILCYSTELWPFAFLCLLPDTAIQQIAWVCNELKAWTSEMETGYVANAHSLEAEKDNVRTSQLSPWFCTWYLSSQIQNCYRVAESTTEFNRIYRCKIDPLFSK